MPDLTMTLFPCVHLCIKAFYMLMLPEFEKKILLLTWILGRVPVINQRFYKYAFAVHSYQLIQRLIRWNKATVKVKCFPIKSEAWKARRDGGSCSSLSIIQFDGYVMGTEARWLDGSMADCSGFLHISLFQTSTLRYLELLGATSHPGSSKGWRWVIIWQIWTLAPSKLCKAASVHSWVHVGSTEGGLYCALRVLTCHFYGVSGTLGLLQLVIQEQICILT